MTRRASFSFVARDLRQVLSERFFGMGVSEHLLRRVMHVTQVPVVLRITTVSFARRSLEQHDAGADFSRH
jgi:hypothetical protein